MVGRRDAALARGAGVVVLAVVVACALLGCVTEYRGRDSEIDGELWRRIASFEDPLSRSLYGQLHEPNGIFHTRDPDLYPARAETPEEYLAGIDEARWDGRERSLASLGLEHGGAILYDVATAGTATSFSIFIASGPRSDGLADDGGEYSGPSEVYTCYRFDVEFDTATDPRADRTAFDECPAPLVGRLADDAAFASAEVFDG